MAELGAGPSCPDAHLRPAAHGPGGWTGHIPEARGLGRGPGEVRTGGRLQGALLIRPHAADAEHGAAGEAPRPAGAGARLPPPCPPPAGHTGSRGSGLGPVPGLSPRCSCHPHPWGRWAGSQARPRNLGCPGLLLAAWGQGHRGLGFSLGEEATPCCLCCSVDPRDSGA